MGSVQFWRSLHPFVQVAAFLPAQLKELLDSTDSFPNQTKPFERPELCLNSQHIVKNNKLSKIIFFRNKLKIIWT